MRRGRKARDLGIAIVAIVEAARLPGTSEPVRGEPRVKIRMARITLALATLASMALSLSAGMRWN